MNNEADTTESMLDGSYLYVANLPSTTTISATTEFSSFPKCNGGLPLQHSGVFACIAATTNFGLIGNNLGIFKLNSSSGFSVCQIRAYSYHHAIPDDFYPMVISPRPSEFVGEGVAGDNLYLRVGP
jgi:hypothetical protein